MSEAQAPAVETPAAKKKAVVVIGAVKNLPKADIVIVAESRTPDADGVPQLVTSGYPSGADLYYRTEEAVKFPAKAKIVTLGIDALQDGFWGFTPKWGDVCVGPAHPAFAAANLAYQMGATEIEIVGLVDAEKERLKPYFDDLPTNAVAPAQVAVSF